MEGRAALAAALIILLAVQFYATVASNTQTAGKPLIEVTHHEIPQGLPWYPIVVFGDNRPEVEVSTKFTPVFLEILNETRIINPYAMIGTGDQVGRGTPWQIEALYKLLSQSGIWNIWLAVGNHDIQYGGSAGQWSRTIAPLHYQRDDFPGWRIAVLDDETGGTDYWRSQLENTTAGLGNRSLILVYHKPVLPNVGHNMDPARANILLSFIKSHPGKIRLALQGHWHGYAVERKYNVTWIITGGAGAPLYENRGPRPGNDTLIITGRNHYLVLILYPDGTFKYTTILVNGSTSRISYKVEEESAGNTTVVKGLVDNSLVNIEGKPVAVPVRINLTSNWDSFIELTANPDSITWFKFTANSTGYWVESNSTTWYAVISNGTNSIVLDQDHPYAVNEQNTTKSKTTSSKTGQVTEAAETTHETLAATTSTPAPVAQEQSSTSASTSTPSQAGATIGKNKSKTLAEWAAAAFILIAAIIYVGKAHG